jgi:hypothetical protein
MIIDFELLRRTWRELPLYPCPTCGRGYLEEKKKVSENTRRSLDYFHESGEEPEVIDGRFFFYLECKVCGEGVGISGTTNPIETYDEDHGRTYVDDFEVLSMVPSLRIITVPDQTPQEVLTAIRKAENLWFPDASAAANQLRIACERLMDSYCPVAPQTFVSLHSRIEAFGRLNNGQYSQQATLLQSAKWIGNHGSHTGSLKDEDVYFEAHVLAQVLHDIYDDTKANLMAKAHAINANKGPVP